jgi:hypothetical protein
MDKQHERRQLNLDPPHWFLQRGVFETSGSFSLHVSWTGFEEQEPLR